MKDEKNIREEDIDIDYLISSGNLKDALIEIRKKTGMNRKVFADYFKIPYRTVQDWELGNRQMPAYLFELMKYKLEKENKD